MLRMMSPLPWSHRLGLQLMSFLDEARWLQREK